MLDFWKNTFLAIERKVRAIIVISTVMLIMYMYMCIVLVVTELDELVGVVVDNPKASLGALGYYQVSLIMLS